jgi:hypothetical protein
MTTRQPIGGAAAWRGPEMAESTAWLRRLEPSALAEIDAALRTAQRRGVSWGETSRADFPLPEQAALLADVGRELEEGRGVVKLGALPIARYAEDELKQLFFGLGSHLGRAVHQSAKGELLGEIRDEGAAAAARRGQLVSGDGGEVFLSSRGRVQTTGPLRFHTDRTDVVGLLCVRQAAAGGINKIVSSVAIHDEMLARRPDLLDVLFQDYHRSRLGEEAGGESRSYALPVFALRDGHFTSHYSRTYVEAAQRNPKVPPMSAEQWEAIDLLAALGEELCFETSLEPGEMLFLNNHVIYHARSAYEDEAAAGRERLLYRLWLSMPNSRPLPEGHQVLWGNIEAGALRGGIAQAGEP